MLRVNILTDKIKLINITKLKNKLIYGLDDDRECALCEFASPKGCHAGEECNFLFDEDILDAILEECQISMAEGLSE